MANATVRVGKGSVRWTDEFMRRSVKTLTAAATYYTGAMVGLNVNGYWDKFDDTSSLLFAGIVRGREGDPIIPISTQGDGTGDLDVHRPRYFELAIASVALTDIGKPVYASDDQTGTLDPSTRTYANLVGMVVDKVATSIALVKPVYDGVAAHRRLGASLFLAATGAITLAKWDLNKTIFIQGTAAQTITLPAVAGCPAGSRLHFIKLTSNAVAATLDGNAAETIDGALTLATIDAQFDTAILVSDGTQWVVEARDIS